MSRAVHMEHCQDRAYEYILKLPNLSQTIPDKDIRFLARALVSTFPLGPRFQS
jgi:hypothetical protein